MVRIFSITGGMYPHHGCKSSSIAVDTETIQEGYDSIKEWAKKNFKEWNNINHDSKLKRALITIPRHTSVDVYVHRK